MCNVHDVMCLYDVMCTMWLQGLPAQLQEFGGVICDVKLVCMFVLVLVLQGQGPSGV
jgi:hypothetical protein